MTTIARTTWPPVAPERPLLTPRQTEVLALVADGLSNKEIATRLEIECRTVDRHLCMLRERLGVTGDTRVRLALFWLQSSGRLACPPRLPA